MKWLVKEESFAFGVGLIGWLRKHFDILTMAGGFVLCVSVLLFRFERKPKGAGALPPDLKVLNGSLEAELQQARSEGRTRQADNERLMSELQMIQERNRALQQETERLTADLSKMDSFRLRVWAVLVARHSATFSAILRDLEIDSTSPESNEVLGILGALAEQGRIENDGTSVLSYRITKR